MQNHDYPTSLNRLLFIGVDVFIITLLIGMVYSTVAMSIGIIGLSVLAILYAFVSRGLLSTLKKRWLLSYSLIYVIVLLSFLNSDSTTILFHQLQMKSSFLGLPLFAFVFQNKLERDARKYMLMFCGVAFCSMLPLVINTLLRYDSFIDTLSVGQAVQTPMDHVRYSIFLGLAVVYLAYECFMNNAWRHRWLLVVAMVIIFISLHILAIRSGIVLSYIGITILLFAKLLKSGRKAQFIPYFFVLFTLPIMAYFFLPGFHQKVHYSLFDYKKFLEGDGKNYSDSERLYSYGAAIDLIPNNLLLGTGIGDLKEEMRSAYQTRYQLELSKYPHNQYLFYLAGAGLVGFLIFLIAIGIPIVKSWNTASLLFLLYQALFTLTFLIENILERSFSGVLYLFVSLMTLFILSKEHKSYSDNL